MTWTSGNRYTPRLPEMLVLAMTASCDGEIPSIVFDHSDCLTDLHAKLLCLAGTHFSSGIFLVASVSHEAEAAPSCQPCWMTCYAFEADGLLSDLASTRTMFSSSCIPSSRRTPSTRKSSSSVK